MGYHNSDDSNNFERHEIKTFQRKGDQVRSEYERLNPDGTVTKSVAYGDCKEGLRYRTFQMGLDGVVRELAPEQFVPRPPQQQQPAPPQQQAVPQQQQAVSQQQPRKAFGFMVEPKNQQDQPGGTWKLRPFTIKEEKPAETSSQKEAPWWYEKLKEVFREEPKEEKIEERPPPLPEKKVSRNIFDLFDHDFFSFKPFVRTASHRPRWNSPFDLLTGDSFFDRPLLGFSRSLLEDF